MPYTLTEAEKNQLRQKYLENVATINKYLSDDMKVRPDLKTLNKRMNDPNEQRTYKKGLELNERERRRQEIYDELADKYGHLKQPGKQYALNRLISYQFDMSNDPEAKAYNENVIKNYYLHPEAMAQRECKKIIKYNPQEALKISKSKDMEGFLMEYYERHAEEVENAFGLLGTVNNVNKDNIKTPETQQYLDGIAPNYEVLSTSSEVVKNMTDGFYTMPKLTVAQEDALFDTNFDRENVELNEELKRQKRINTFRTQSYKQYKDFFNKMEKTNKDFCTPGSLNTYVAEGKFGAKTKYYGITSVMDGLEKDVKIIKLDEEKKKSIEQLFTKDFAKEENFVQHDFIPSVKKSEEQVKSDFRYEYALLNNKSMAEMDKKDMLSCLKDHKGGFWERKIGTTSPEYKAFERSVEDYYNISEKSGDRDNVINAANAYLVHKGIDINGKDVEAQVARLGATARGRARFCISTIRALKQPEYVPENKLDYVQDKEKSNGIQNANDNEIQKSNFIDKEPAIPDKEVLEDKVQHNDVVIKETEPENVVELDKNEPNI